MGAAIANALKKIGAHLLQKSATDPEGGRGCLKKTLILLAVLLTILLLIPAILLSIPGAIIKGDKEPESFEITESKIYERVKEAILDFNEEIDRRIEEEAAEIREEFSWEEETTDPETGETTTEKRYPTVTTVLNLEKPRLSYVFSYLNIKHYGKDGGWKFKKKEVQDFLNGITSLESSVKVLSREKIEYTATTNLLTADQIAKKYFKDDQVDQYLTSYESFVDLDDGDEELQESYEELDLSDLTTHGDGMKIPHYLQYDTRWGRTKYGTYRSDGRDTISCRGCGPTCMAMVATYLTGNVVLPPETAKWSENHGYYIRDQGTAWGFYTAAASQWGFKGRTLGYGRAAYQEVLRGLSEGKPVIASMRPGTFTKYGHFIVLRGITENGRILVNDPNDNFYKKNFHKKAFDAEFMYKESKAFWIFSR